MQRDRTASNREQVRFLWITEPLLFPPLKNADGPLARGHNGGVTAGFQAVD